RRASARSRASAPSSSSSAERRSASVTEVAEVVVTGIGLVTALGPDRARTWEAVKQGRRGFSPLTLFELPGRPAPIVAQVPLFPRRKGLPRRALAGSSRTDRMALVAALDAARDAGLEGRLERAAL